MIHNENLFIDDLNRKDMLYVLPITSSIPRGKIKKIISHNLPEGYGILGPDDIPGKKELEIMGDTIPFFAGEELDYEGQTIRLLYGPDENMVNTLRKKIRIEYETDFTLYGFRGYTPEQILKEKKVSRGKLPRKDIEYTYESGEYHLALESSNDTIFGGFAVLENSKLLIQGASQWPYFIKDALAKGLDLDPKKIIIQGTAGTQGGESPIWYPCILMFQAALAAFITRKPCRIIIPAKESLLNCPERSPATFKFTSTLTPKGRVAARKVEVDIDAGSTEVLSEELLDRLCLSVMGAYPLGHTEIVVKLIKTSNPPLDNFEGLGMAQGFCAIELHENHLASLLNEDPLERKKTWCLTQGKPFLTGGIYDIKMKPEELLEKAGEMSDFRRKYGSYQLRSRSTGRPFPINPKRGIGISLAFQGNGFISVPPGRFSVSVQLNANEEVSIRTSSVPAYPRTKEIWKETAAEILQVSSTQITIESIDTTKVPDSGPALFSNNITIIPRLIEQCCQSIKKKRFRAPLPIAIKRTFRLPSSRTWNRETFQGQPFISMSWASAAVEVEIDPVSFIPELRGVWMSLDCGRIMDLDYARSVVESSIYSTLHNHIRGLKKISDFPQSGSAFESKTPLPIHIHFYESRENKPGGLGSLAANTVPAAFLAAVSQASGISMNKLPFAPNHIFSGKGEKE
ncbi:MAG: xanthine dehydrogenase family protein [Spirochaetales bacterium]|nr:xanthine dehydrogenase family protein [Spirochaetales bacterium]